MSWLLRSVQIWRTLILPANFFLGTIPYTWNELPHLFTKATVYYVHKFYPFFCMWQSLKPKELDFSMFGRHFSQYPNSAAWRKFTVTLKQTNMEQKVTKWLFRRETMTLVLPRAATLLSDSFECLYHKQSLCSCRILLCHFRETDWAIAFPQDSPIEPVYTPSSTFAI